MTKGILDFRLFFCTLKEETTTMDASSFKKKNVSEIFANGNMPNICLFNTEALSQYLSLCKLRTFMQVITLQF